MPVVQPAHGNEELPSGQVVRERCVRLDPTTTKTRGQRSDTSDDGRFQRVRGRVDSDASRSEKGGGVYPGAGDNVDAVLGMIESLDHGDQCRSGVSFLVHTRQEILQDADERSCTDSKADEKKDVVLLVVLSWSTVRPVYQKLRQAAITTTSSASETSPRTLY
ncbi:hypothetical protein GW17_00033674 [Ensete ventricosum]|nr:hypothetical protein GW17_00033674 [Ensete ventricosum]